MVQEARCAPLPCLTLKFKKVTFHYSVRAALRSSTAASILLLLFSSNNCCNVSPSPPPPLCCHGNTHTEQSGRPMPRARYQGCCSDCRCISRHPPAWPGRWWGCRRWECALSVSDHCKRRQMFCHTFKQTNMSGRPSTFFFFSWVSYIKVP